jgi:hypothetical protein
VSAKARSKVTLRTIFGMLRVQSRIELMIILSTP